MPYKGYIADFPVGQGGLNTDDNYFNIPITDLVTANNIRYDGKLWIRSPGLSVHSTSNIVNATCLAGIDWWPDASSQSQVTVWTDGTIYAEAGGAVDATELENSHTFTDTVSIVEGGAIGATVERELYFFGKGNSPVKLVGSNAAVEAITAEADDWTTDKPSGATYHDARIYAWGVEEAPHNFYISSLNDHGDFSFTGGGRAFEIAPGQGHRISSMFSFAPYTLFAFKYPRGIYEIDTSNVTGFYMPISLLRNDIGSNSPNGVIKVGNDVWFISEMGRLYSLTALAQGVDPRDADITAALGLERFLSENLKISRLPHAKLVYDATRKELWYIFTSKAGTVNDMALIFDFSDPQQVKVSVDNRAGYLTQVWNYIVSDDLPTLLTAGENGIIYRADKNSPSIGANSDTYLSEFEYPETDFGFVDPSLKAKVKRFDFVELTLLVVGDYQLGCNIIIDQEFNSTKFISLSSDAAVYGTAVYGTDVYSSQIYLKKRIPIDAVGTTLGLGFFLNEADRNFKIAAIRVYFSINENEYEV